MFPEAEAFAAQREQPWGDCLVRRPQPGLPPQAAGTMQVCVRARPAGRGFLHVPSASFLSRLKRKKIFWNQQQRGQ